MKKQAYTLIAMIVLVGSMAVVAQAQTGSRTQLVANIPFEFSVGNKTLPAGEYIVRQVNANSDRAVMQLRSRNEKSSALIQMDSVIGKPQESAKLIFRRYDNHYFFAQAWVDGDKTGFETSKSRAERAVAREVVEIRLKTEAVALKNR